MSMIDEIVLGLNYFNDFIRVINPFLFFGCTCIWVKLYWSTQSMWNRNSLRQHCIEQQIDYIVNNRDIDKEYIDYLRKIYSGF